MRAALLEREGSIVRATLPDYLNCHQKEVLRRVQNEARKHWWRDAHPGWGICEFMTEDDLIQNVHTQVRCPEASCESSAGPECLPHY